MSLRTQIKHQLNAAQIEAFETDGVVCLKNVITPGEIEGLRTSVMHQMDKLSETHTAYDFESIAQQVWADKEAYDVGAADRFDMADLRAIIEHDSLARPIRDKIENAGVNNGRFFYDAAGWRTFGDIRAAAMDSVLPEVCAQLLRSEYINFWEDTTFVKEPLTGQRTAFHQDYSYFQIEGNKCCIVWIPLDPVSAENGPMEYIRGSHLWNETYAPNILIGQSVDPFSPFPRCPDIEANEQDYDIVSFDVEPGDVIIHHVMTVHGSRGNVSRSKPRRAISFRYCGDDIRYLDRPGAVVQPYLQEKQEDGESLYSKDYPLVWPRPFPGAKIAPIFDNVTLMPNTPEKMPTQQLGR